MKKLFGSLIVLFVCLVYACSKKSETSTAQSSPADCNGIDSRFSLKVLPIIQSKCTSSGCHGVGSLHGPGALTNFSQISNAAAAIGRAVDSGEMPKDGRLSVQDKNAILCWVSDGSPNN